MNLKSYTSTLNTTQSISRIETLLIVIGATQITKHFEIKQCIGITFKLFDEKSRKMLEYSLHPRIKECFNSLSKDITPDEKWSRQDLQLQASKIAWNILHDWVEVQSGVVLIGHALPKNVF